MGRRMIKSGSSCIESINLSEKLLCLYSENCSCDEDEDGHAENQVPETFIGRVNDPLSA